MNFPTIKASNLSKQTFRLPGDLEGQLNVIAIAFQRWHQDEVDSWVPALEQMEHEIPGLRYYELPVIRSMNPINQWLLDEGMRAGIPSRSTRARTITIYTDKARFRQALDLPNEDHIYLLLLDRQGQVLWRGQGPFRPEVARSLADAAGQAVAAVSR